MTQNVLEVDDDSYADLFDVEKSAERSGSGVIEDPFPIWAELRAKAPVHRGTLSECMGMAPERSGTLYRPGMEHYSAFSFDAVSEAFTRKDDFSSGFYTDVGIPHRLGDSILSMDGERHRRFRDIIQPWFQPGEARSWWRDSVIMPLVEQLLGRMDRNGSVDLNAELFARLPMHTVTAGFGLSPQEGIEFRGHMVRAFTDALSEEEVALAMGAAGQILEGVIARRKEKPEDDLISRLAHAELVEQDGSRRKLEVEEIVTFCRLIVFAGGDTTWRQSGICMFALLSHPDQLADVIADPSLLSNAVLESTRWNPDPLFPRKVIRNTELQGVKLPAGAALHLCIGAANRDPSRWDNPDQFDIHRPVQRSLAFAAGAHSCLGQHVARQEIEAAIGTLLERFPKIRWDPSRPPAKLTGGLVHRGPGPLHVLLN